MLVHGARLDRGEDIIRQEFLPQVFDDDLACAGLVGLVNDRIYVIALPDIGNEGNYVVVIVFFQPRNNDGGIQPS